MKTFYAISMVLGTLLPYSQLVMWLGTRGVELRAIVAAIATTPAAAFAWLDVLISAVVLIGFIVIEGRRLGMSFLWLPVVATLSVGVSCGLPLFLLMRESRLDRVPSKDRRRPRNSNS